MGYQNFETESAEYTLYLGNHLRSSYPMIEENGGLESLDVLVMENSGMRLDGENEWSKLSWYPQYKEIFENIPEKNPELKVYFCDAKLTDFGIGISILKEVLMFPISVPLILAQLFYYNTNSKKEPPGILAKINTLYELIIPTPLMALRDAITARSIEERIVPKETIKGKKTRVGILYGAFHSGIKSQIKHKKLREAIIAMYKRLGYPGIDSENYHITRATNCSTDNAIISVEDVEL